MTWTVGEDRGAHGWVDQFLAAVRASGAGAEFHEYAGSGHLFTDASRPDEFDAPATEALWNHVDDFLRNVPDVARVSASAGDRPDLL